MVLEDSDRCAVGGTPRATARDGLSLPLVQVEKGVDVG